jgi:hypothetical protein
MRRLPANEWVTIGSCFGLTQRLLHVVVDTDTECKWRERVGWLITCSGTFRRRHTFRLFNQTAQIWSPTEISYEPQHEGAADVAPVPCESDVRSSTVTRSPSAARPRGPAWHRPW